MQGHAVVLSNPTKSIAKAQEVANAADFKNLVAQGISRLCSTKEGPISRYVTESRQILEGTSSTDQHSLLSQICLK